MTQPVILAVVHVVGLLRQHHVHAADQWLAPQHLAHTCTACRREITTAARALHHGRVHTAIRALQRALWIVGYGQ